jgi:hypothetical protein
VKVQVSSASSTWNLQLGGTLHGEKGGVSKQHILGKGWAR